MIDQVLFYTILVLSMCWLASHLALATYAWVHTKDVPLTKRLVNAAGFPGAVVSAYAYNLRLVRGDMEAAAKKTLEGMPRLARPPNIGEWDT